MIKPLNTKDLERFCAYLGQHLAENGRDSPLFQPQSRDETHLPSDTRNRFAEGLLLPVGESSWRRAWIAEDALGDIAGHVDLRARPEPHTAHRALLGLGVRRDIRRNSIGQQLVEFAMNWARQSGTIEIADLAVLSNNYPAIKLYEKLGFTTLCRIEDMFRIDGQSEGDIIMTKRL